MDLVLVVMGIVISIIYFEGHHRYTMAGARLKQHLQILRLYIQTHFLRVILGNRSFTFQ